MLACKIVLALLLSFTTYGAAAVTSEAWVTPDLRVVVSLTWALLFLFWLAYYRILCFDPDSK